MDDPSHVHRIEMLERMLRALTEGAGGDALDLPMEPAGTAASGERNQSRLDTLETMMLALTNSIVMINQQVAQLSAELNELRATGTPGKVHPMTIDASQDVRLDTLENMLQTLRAGVTDYDQQMAELVTRCKSRKLNRLRSTSPSQVA